MEDENGKITFAATGSTLKQQEYFLKTQNRKYSLPHHRKHKDPKDGFNDDFTHSFRERIRYMRKLIEESEKSGPISTDKETKCYKGER